MGERVVADGKEDIGVAVLYHAERRGEEGRERGSPCELRF
jgi:hypothetical protein